MPLPRPLRGIVPPLLTPLVTPDTPDLKALDRLVDHVIDGGVHGIFVLGTSGEGPALSGGAQREVMHRACERAAGRVPVLVGVSHASLAESIALAREARSAGADGVVTTGPLYFPASQEALLEYSTRIADASPLPVFLYNIPSHSQVQFLVDTLRAAAAHPNIVGLKDSTADMIFLHEVVRAVGGGEFTLLIGPEELMAEAVLFGAHGGVNGGSNLFPKLYVALHAAAATGDLESVRLLQEAVTEVSVNIYSPCGYLRGVKCAAAALGLCDEVFAAPVLPVPEANRREIQGFARTFAAGI